MTFFVESKAKSDLPDGLSQHEHPFSTNIGSLTIIHILDTGTTIIAYPLWKMKSIAIFQRIDFLFPKTLQNQNHFACRLP